jgi:hypothetical protein
LSLTVPSPAAGGQANAAGATLPDFYVEDEADAMLARLDT